ncbi:MerR family transcriptional regulator [Lactiplantibacillus garii]|uniref:MerR family transcriptional regulator n=1 Tax=Lactiplantibacillus garii TaxID=2306423 RepID=A0A426D761_9LACO|nr:MerR family transcriptional regulator [Lactiplantibacillus garii]RRK10421.1 MerR family transcriptional regulator [Lactiplantibacillus garii]
MTEPTATPDQATKLVASVAAQQLGIKAVTLRKYSTLVEKQLADETRFRTADNSHRLYSPADLETFKAAIALTERGVTLANALEQTFDPHSHPVAPAPKQPTPASAPEPTTKAVTTQSEGPSNAELAKQQAIIIRRLDSLNYRLNLVLDRLDDQAKQQAAKPWWQFWTK